MYLSDAQFRDVLALTPLVAIDLVVENQRGEILLGLRTNRPAQGYWFVPGGRIMRDETLDGAFERLTHCELDRVCARADARLLGVFDHRYEDDVFDAGIGTHYVVLAYHLVLDIEPEDLPRLQHSAYRWLLPTEMSAEKRVHPYTLAYLGALNSMAEQIPSVRRSLG